VTQREAADDAQDLRQAAAGEHQREQEQDVVEAIGELPAAGPVPLVRRGADVLDPGPHEVLDPERGGRRQRERRPDLVGDRDVVLAGDLRLDQDLKRRRDPRLGDERQRPVDRAGLRRALGLAGDARGAVAQGRGDRGPPARARRRHDRRAAEARVGDLGGAARHRGGVHRGRIGADEVRRGVDVDIERDRHRRAIGGDPQVADVERVRRRRARDREHQRDAAHREATGEAASGHGRPPSPILRQPELPGSSLSASRV
jgi:hypothetical protein